MMNDLLRDELRTKRRALNAVRLQLARYGYEAPVHLTLEEEDLAKEVRAIERELSAEQTPTLQERRGGPPVPETVFRERIAERQTKARQADIDHQMTLLTIHRRNLAFLREQARYHGGNAAAPLATQNGIQDARASIAGHKRSLREMGVEVDDLPGDE